MVKLSYNLTSAIRDYLQQIENLRGKILLTPLPPKTKLRLRWEANLNRIYYSLNLCDRSLSKNDLIKLLTNQHKKELNEAEKNVYFYKNAIDFLNQNWLVTKREITWNVLKKIQEISKAAGNLNIYQESIKQILEYIQVSDEHSVIKIALFQIQLLQRVLVDESDWRLMSLCSLLFLYKYGYDLEGLLVLEELFDRDRELIIRIKQKVTKQVDLTPWLEYVCQTMTEHLQRIAVIVSEVGFQTEISTAFWDLNDRQKEILLILDQPAITINNRKVQKIFKISQITASRDLTKLSQLGLLYPHGKGRSVYYTKV